MRPSGSTCQLSVSRAGRLSASCGWGTPAASFATRFALKRPRVAPRVRSPPDCRTLVVKAFGSARIAITSVGGGSTASEAGVAAGDPRDSMGAHAAQATRTPSSTALPKAAGVRGGHDLAMGLPFAMARAGRDRTPLAGTTLARAYGWALAEAVVSLSR